MNYNWAPLLGKFDQVDNSIIFKGETAEYGEGKSGPSIGNIICDQSFGGGTLSADIKFTKISNGSACELIIFYDPATKYFVTAGLGGGGITMFNIRHFDSQWTYHAQAGEHRNLKENKIYKVEVLLKGSRVVLNVDGVNVVSANLPFPLAQSQVGIWCLDYSDIQISNYMITKENPKVFIVMQFTTPYNELYNDVIKKICSEFELEAIRADETFTPGIIIADVAKQIIESKLIIADITPSNPNVFYEVGFAHALRKPTILIAEKPTELPFDVSAFRTLFYENSIRGKAKIEDGLRQHIKAILTER
jgi:hypothetical protein